ncbi:uncharacterized protein LOC110687717 [Chenopodium quinoa]|uniref:uncharacterized protein LOC110687717 n=1 Tax=Chenopodium quinoa TaxID=63459 RepID=UPI000B772C2D|nr:uncharacterized protein LOC110687717 [Chenopodium quinoa]
MPDSYVNYMPESWFDHSPAIIQLDSSGHTQRGTFKYLYMWSMHSDFLSIVQHAWDTDIHGIHMYRVVKKLKLLKVELKKLHRKYCTEIELKYFKLKHEIENIQLVLQNDQSNRAKINWLKVGDNNTRFFHNYMKQRQYKSRVIAINERDGNWCDNPEKTADAFVGYYKVLLGTNDGDRTGCELKSALFSIPGDKAPGPDGYNSNFFKHAWSVIGEEVTDASLQFMENGKMLKEINCTTLTLIPKVENPTSVTEFRPIACCNVLYKCITKMICNRLKIDIVARYSRKNSLPGCLLKVDIRKAYDSMKWELLEEMLKALKFPEKFIMLVMSCVTSASFSLVINGKYLSRILGQVGMHRRFKFHPRCKTLRLNHLVFADDMIIFSRYLGINVSAKKLAKDDCQFLIYKITSRVRTWGCRTLSYAGRARLVNSVLMFMHIYWATIFLFPKSVIDGVAAIYRNYLWTRKAVYTKSPPIAWDIVCRSKKQGGLGIQNYKIWNIAALGKQIWNIAQKQDNLWLKWVNEKGRVGRGSSVLIVLAGTGDKSGG